MGFLGGSCRLGCWWRRGRCRGLESLSRDARWWGRCAGGIGGDVVERGLGVAGLSQEHLPAGGGPAEDLIVDDVGTAVVRRLPREMRAGRVACPRQAGRLRGG